MEKMNSNIKNYNKNIKPFKEKKRGIRQPFQCYNIDALYRDFIVSKVDTDPITGRVIRNKGKDVLSLKEFRDCLNFMNGQLVTKMVTEGKFFKIPYGQGELKFIKYLITPEYIDYIYRLTQGKVYIPSTDTKESTYRIKIKYSKKNNKTYMGQFYSFAPSSTFTKAVSNQLNDLEEYSGKGVGVGHRSFFDN
jgi:hypothetical protein